MSVINTPHCVETMLFHDNASAMFVKVDTVAGSAFVRYTLTVVT
jgi:hypothetical protein